MQEKKPYSSKEFNELKNEWYDKLESTGFKDIEARHHNSTKAFLKTWDSSYFKLRFTEKDQDFYQLKADYFYYAVQFLYQNNFNSPLEREIWFQYTEGFGCREIAKRINAKKEFTLLGKDDVWQILKKLKPEMQKFLNASKEDIVLSKEEILAFRSAKPEDEAFIYSTWLQNLYANCRWRYPITRQQFLKSYHDVVQRCLNKPWAKVNICCLKEDPDVIVGYSVYEENPIDTVLHWIYVRADWQGQRIMYDLLPKKTITVVTHMTKIGARIWTKKIRELKRLQEKKMDEAIFIPKIMSITNGYEMLETPFSVEPRSNT